MESNFTLTANKQSEFRNCLRCFVRGVGAPRDSVPAEGSDSEKADGSKLQLVVGSEPLMTAFLLCTVGCMHVVQHRHAPAAPENGDDDNNNTRARPSGGQGSST